MVKRKKGGREERENGRIKKMSPNAIKYKDRDEMEWDRRDEGTTETRNFKEFLTVALIGWGNKSEVTLQVPSISRLFYMGSFALMGEPSMEQSRESNDGMAGLPLQDD